MLRRSRQCFLFRHGSGALAGFAPVRMRLPMSSVAHPCIVLHVKHAAPYGKWSSPMVRLCLSVCLLQGAAAHCLSSMLGACDEVITHNKVTNHRALYLTALLLPCRSCWMCRALTRGGGARRRRSPTSSRHAIWTSQPASTCSRQRRQGRYTAGCGTSG